MKVYIATKFENYNEFKRAQALLEEAGHTITHDWTKESYEGREGPELFHYLQKCAGKDLAGVANADAVLFIPFASRPMVGAYVELGYALAGFGKRIIAVDAFNPIYQHNIFWNLSQIEHVKTIEEAVESLK